MSSSICSDVIAIKTKGETTYRTAALSFIYTSIPMEKNLHFNFRKYSNPRYDGPGYNRQNLAVYNCEFLEMLRC
jgi:hypothetical protein